MTSDTYLVLLGRFGLLKFSTRLFYRVLRRYWYMSNLDHVLTLILFTSLSTTWKDYAQLCFA